MPTPPHDSLPGNTFNMSGLPLPIGSGGRQLTCSTDSVGRSFADLPSGTTYRKVLPLSPHSQGLEDMFHWAFILGRDLAMHLRCLDQYATLYIACHVGESGTIRMPVWATAWNMIACRCGTFRVYNSGHSHFPLFEFSFSIPLFSLRL
jgi:hypothetical protein